MTDLSFIYQENLILKAENEKLRAKLGITRKALQKVTYDVMYEPSDCRKACYEALAQSA